MHTRCNTLCETETKEVTQTMFQVKIRSMFDFIDVFGHDGAGNLDLSAVVGTVILL